ncbi:MAG TPA: nuclear transport factor 2 family protein [Anaeromyxobacteraceae bacterium]|nr:nuclear transport factor 2 family protein [Anaeromyxobacteraceae bacterium]
MPRSGSGGAGIGIWGTRRRLRFGKSGAPYLVPSLLALAAIVLAWLYWDRLTTIPASVEAPETQIRRALANQARAHLSDVYGFKAGGTAELYEVRYGDVTARVEGGKATVLAMVEAQGRLAWRDEAATLSYVGRERFGMTPCSIALWCGDGDQFGRLRDVLTLLFRRADAFNARDAEAYARLVSDRYDGGKAPVLARLRKDLAGEPAAKLDVLGWQIRVERERAIVGEDYAIRLGDGPERRHRARFELALEGGRWRIVSGL